MSSADAIYEEDSFDLLGEFESQEEDEVVLEEIAEKRKRSRKSFLSVINKKNLSDGELDEVML